MVVSLEIYCYRTRIILLLLGFFLLFSGLHSISIKNWSRYFILHRDCFYHTVKLTIILLTLCTKVSCRIIISSSTMWPRFIGSILSIGIEKERQWLEFVQRLQETRNKWIDVTILSLSWVTCTNNTPNLLNYKHFVDLLVARETTSRTI